MLCSVAALSQVSVPAAWALFSTLVSAPGGGPKVLPGAQHFLMSWTLCWGAIKALVHPLEADQPCR